MNVLFANDKRTAYCTLHTLHNKDIFLHIFVFKVHMYIVHTYKEFPKHGILRLLTNILESAKKIFENKCKVIIFYLTFNLGLVYLKGYCCNTSRNRKGSCFWESLYRTEFIFDSSRLRCLVVRRRFSDQFIILLN